MKTKNILRLCFCSLILAGVITIITLRLCGFEMSEMFDRIYQCVLLVVIAIFYLWEYYDNMTTIKEKDEKIFILSCKLRELGDGGQLIEDNKRLIEQVKNLEREIKNKNISMAMYKKNSKKYRQQIKEDKK